MFGVLIQKNKLFILCWQSPKNINKAYQVLKFITFKTHLPSRFPHIILLQSSGLRLNEVSRPWSFHFLVFSLVRPFLISSCPPGSRLSLNNASVRALYTNWLIHLTLFRQGGSTETLGKPVFPPRSQSCSLLFSSSYNVSSLFSSSLWVLKLSKTSSERENWGPITMIKSGPHGSNCLRTLRNNARSWLRWEGLLPQRD